MKMSNSNPKADTIDYYSIVSGIRPGRSPSIFHKEYKYYWTDFPMPPVFKIYNTTFNKVTPLPHCVDCSRYGQLHYWARVGSIYSPVLVVVYFEQPGKIERLRIYFYGGLWVENPLTFKMDKVNVPDLELFRYALAGFLKDFLN